jgi:hypothetical protein
MFIKNGKTGNNLKKGLSEGLAEAVHQFSDEGTLVFSFTFPWFSRFYFLILSLLPEYPDGRVGS